MRRYTRTILWMTAPFLLVGCKFDTGSSGFLGASMLNFLAQTSGSSCWGGTLASVATTSCKIGINMSTDPANKLDVNGSIGVFDVGGRTHFAGIQTNVAGALIEMGTNVDNSSLFGGAYTQGDQGGRFRVDARGGIPLFSFRGRAAGATTDSSLVSILSNGNVGIATTTPAHKLDVVGTAGLSTGTAWTNTSDRRVKRNIQAITDAEKKLMSLKPVAFAYQKHYLSEHPELKDRTYFGFVAQDFQEVFPDRVSREKNHGYLQIDVTDVTPYLVAAAQKTFGSIAGLSDRLEKETIGLRQSFVDATHRLESQLSVLKAKIDDQEKRIAELNKENDELKTRLAAMKKSQDDLAARVERLARAQADSSTVARR